VDARVHLGADAPIVRLRWVFTDLPWLRVEGGIVINNRIWNSDNVEDLPIGQVPIVEANYVQDARWIISPGITGEHICHEEWLSTGEPFPNDLPPTEYDDNGFPVCCKGNSFTDATAGGVEIVDLATFNDPTEGGVEIGRQVDDVLLFPDPARGGVEIGEEKIRNDPTEGGVEIGRQVDDVLLFPDPAAGGVEIGGRGAEPDIRNDPAAGGVEVGGAAGDVLLFPDPAAGGVEVGGHLGGGAPFNDPAAGGVEVGGAAGDVFIPVNPYCLAYNAIGAGTFTRLPYPDDLTWVRFDGEYTLTAPSYTPFAGGPWLLFRASDGGRWSSITGWNGVGCFFFSQLHPPTVPDATFNVCCAD